MQVIYTKIYPFIHLATGNTDVNLSFEIFLRLIGKILNKQAPMKKTSRKNKKKKSNLWSQGE